MKYNILESGIRFKMHQESEDVIRSTPYHFGHEESGFGAVVYYRSYSRIKEDGTQEHWPDTVIRVINGLFTIRKWWYEIHSLRWKEADMQKLALEMTLSMLQFKWLPPGRGLWIGGSDFAYEKGSAAFMNPLHEDTKIFTKEFGLIALKDIEGRNVHVLSFMNKNLSNAGWAPARISTTEYQPCYEIIFRSPSGRAHSVVASVNHRWFTRKNTKDVWHRVSTTELEDGWYLPRTRPSTEFRDLCPVGIMHGFFFGDGNRSGNVGCMSQFTDEDKELLCRYWPEEFIKNGPVLNSGLRGMYGKNMPLAWSKLPSGDYLTDRRYLLSFLAGYFAADGSISGGNIVISSSRLCELEEIKNFFIALGIDCSLRKDSSTHTNYSNSRELYRLTLFCRDIPEIFFVKNSQRLKFVNLLNSRLRKLRTYNKIVSVKPVSGMQRVLCATVPDYENFTIEGFCTTSNCAYITIRHLAQDCGWLMNMLMHGVGVGWGISEKPQELFSKKNRNQQIIMIEDSREGWVDSVEKLLYSLARLPRNHAENNSVLVRSAHRYSIHSSH